MSVVIAARYKDGIAIAGDKQATIGNTKSDNATKLKFFNDSRSCIGVVGYLRDCNVMRTVDEMISPGDILHRTEVDEEYVIKKVVPSIITTLLNNKRVSDVSGVIEMHSNMLYITPKRMFYIGSDFGVIEAEGNFEVIGCGNEKVIGYMSKLEDTSNFTKEQIVDVLAEAIQVACEKDIYINERMDIAFCERELPKLTRGTEKALCLKQKGGIENE